MTRRDTHDQVADLLGPLALGVLEPAERARVERHVAGCARCQDALAELTATAGLLGRLTPEEADSGALLPSPGFADRVVTEIAARRRADESRMRRLQVVLAGAAALAVLVGGIATATGLSREAPPTARVEALRVTSAAGVQASAGAIAHTWGVEIVLTASGFAAGETYAVEVLDRQGVRSTAGAFVGTGARTMVCRLNSGVLRPDAVSFRVRDAAGVEQVTGTLG